VAQWQEELAYLKRLKKFYQPFFVEVKCNQVVKEADGPAIFLQLEQGEQEDAAAMAKKLSNDFKKVAFIQFDRRFFLASPSAQLFDTIKFLKEKAEILQLKGGGPQGFCQGLMKQNNLEQIAETIKMMIKQN